MARHNVVRKIKNRTTIILVMLLISIMVSWVIWGKSVGRNNQINSNI